MAGARERGAVQEPFVQQAWQRRPFNETFSSSLASSLDRKKLRHTMEDVSTRSHPRQWCRFSRKKKLREDPGKRVDEKDGKILQFVKTGYGVPGLLDI